MPPQRLSALDASFLAVESPSAHMHVGWAATFEPPEHGPRPDFDDLFAHIAGRLALAPRFRQRIAPDALGLNAPLWIDAEDFDPGEHIHRSAAEDLAQLTDAVLSEPLAATARCGSSGSPIGCATAASGSSARPTTAWSTASPRSSSAHCCSTPRPPRSRPRRTRSTGCPPPPPARSSCSRAAPGISRASSSACCATRSRWPARRSRSPPSGCAPPVRSPARCCRSRRRSRLNEPGSPARHLATTRRPLSDLRAIRRRTG